jgi:hypothetical protein
MELDHDWQNVLIKNGSVLLFASIKKAKNNWLSEWHQ